MFIDKAAVRGLYKQLMDGWNTGSGEAFAAFHQSLFDKRFKGTRLVGKEMSAVFDGFTRQRIKTQDLKATNVVTLRLSICSVLVRQ